MNVDSGKPAENPVQRTSRADALADRLERGAQQLAAFASTLTDAEWQIPVPGDGRSVGVVVHHVGNMYPIEMQLAHVLAGGQPITGVLWATVHGINAQHALDYANVSKADALDLLQRNSTAAAEAIRAMTDEMLAAAAPVSLYEDAPLTCQFFLEDHAVRHSYHHLARVRQAVGRV